MKKIRLAKQSLNDHKPKESMAKKRKSKQKPTNKAARKAAANRITYSSRKNILLVALIALWGAGLYFQTYNYEYTLDDGIYTYFNSATQQGLKSLGDFFQYGSLNFLNIDATNSGSYRPFTLLTFALEKQVLGEFNPVYSHIVNIVLYFAVLLFIGLVLLRLSAARQLPAIIPLLVLLLYATHPLHVEVVSSVKSRDTLLSALFAFSAIYLWLRNANGSNLWQNICVSLLFLLAVFSKEESITMIAVVFLIAYFFLNEKLLKSLQHTLPFWIPAIVYLIIRSIVLDPPSTAYNSIINNVVFGAQGLERIATNFYVYLFYIKLLLFPYPLSWDYSFDQITVKTISNGWVLLSILSFIGLAFIAAKGFRKKTIPSFAILFYLSTFSVFSNLIPSITIGSTVGERFMFIPSLGFCILLVFGLYSGLQRLGVSKQVPTLLVIILLLAGVYTVKSFSRTFVWKNNLTLLRSGVEDAPRSWRTHVKLADELRLQATRLSMDTALMEKYKDTVRVTLENAVSHYKQGYAIIGNRAKLTSHLQGLGECYLQLHDTASAKVVFLQAAENPKLFLPQFKLGLIALNEQDYEAAVEYNQRALKANAPNWFATYKNLGISFFRLRDYDQAIAAYEKALEYDTSPDVVAILIKLYSSIGDMEKVAKIMESNNLLTEEDQAFYSLMDAGNKAYAQGKYAEAIQLFKQSYNGFAARGGYNQFPNFLNSWARSHLELGEIAAAKNMFNISLQADPQNAYALMNLGVIAFNHEKNYPQAKAYWTRCLEATAPDYFLVYSNLGTLYLAQNQTGEAIEHYELALKYGSSEIVVKNLYLLWKSKGKQEKMNYYLNLMQQK